MDTTYYTVQFRRVKVAGGEDRVYLIPEVRSEEKAQGPARCPAPTKGNVISLEMGKARMERKQAWKALMEAAWG